MGASMKRILLTSIFLLSTAVGVQAADLLVQDQAPAAASQSINGYVQVMGGVTLPNALEYYCDCKDDGDYDLLSGWALGATIGLETPVDGLSVEVDLLHTVAQYDPNQYIEPYEDYLNSTSVMGNVVYTVDLNETLSLYGGVGAGFVLLDYVDAEDSSYNDSGSGLGYQMFAGVEAAVAENVSLTLEARYQSTFEDVEMESGDLFEFNRTSVLGGVLFSF